MDWKNIHPSYDFATLEDENLPTNPWSLWDSWQNEARKTLDYTNEIALATAGSNARASVRMVLLKHSSPEKGFCWFTNRESEKGKQLQENPYAEILWYNRDHQRQIRIRGQVTELDREAVINYAQSRPIKSQISAYISEQSKSIESKQALIEKFEQEKKKFLLNESEKNKLPVSDTWTGFSLLPKRFEFWQGNTNRLHDRVIYTQETPKNWNISRLQP